MGEVLSYIWIGLGVAVLGVWAARMVLIGPAIRRRVVLCESNGASPPHSYPKVSVLVAARDEQENIETCVRTLLQQDYPQLEVVVADDRSRDRTPAILARLAAEFPKRLRVVTVRELEPGWFGKCHAMRAAVRASDETSTWLLMTDADCRFESPRAVRRGVEEALRTESDFLTIIPQLDAPTWWEKLIQPICALVLIYWFQPDRVNDPRHPTAYANGAYMLLSRRGYETIGGHERVRDQLNEDIQLARFAKESGLRLRVVENDGLYRTRMYATFRQAWRGWSRIFCGALHSPVKAGLAVLLVFVVALLPAVATMGAAIGAAAISTPVIVWAAAFFVEQLVVWRLYSMMRVGRAWSLLYPVAAMVMVGILISAFLKTLGATTTTWRSTTYRAGKEVPPTSATLPSRATIQNRDEPIAAR